MRKFLITLGIFVGILAIAVAVLPSLLDAQRYKETIEAKISTALGRTVTIDGPVTITAFPILKAKAHNLTIHNPEGFVLTNGASIPAFATMPALDAHIKILPLLSKQIEISRFALTRPEISLLQNTKGQNNWTFGQTSQEDKETSPQFSRDGRYADLSLSLGNIAIKDGMMRLQNEQSKLSRTFSHINMKASMGGLDQVMSATGSLDYNGANFSYQSSINTPRLFLDGQEAEFKASINSKVQTLSIDGKFLASKSPHFKAKLNANIPSVLDLDTVLGINNPYGDVTQFFDFSGDVFWSGNALQIDNARTILKSDLQDTVLNYHLTLDLTGQDKPILDGRVKFSSPNVNSLIAALNLTPQQVANFPDAISLIEMVELDTDIQSHKNSLSGREMQLSLRGKTINANYQGQYSYDSQATSPLILDGNIAANSNSIPALLTALNMDKKPSLAPLLQAGTFDIKSQIKSKGDDMVLDGLTIQSDGTEMTLNFDGQGVVGKTPSATGSFTFSAANLATLSANSGLSSPYFQALGAVKASGNIQQTVSNRLAVNDLSATLSNGLLNGGFTGSLSLPVSAAAANSGIQYQGMLNAATNSVRELAKIGGTVLAASTQQGEIYGPMSVAATLTGDSDKISFEGVKVAIDDIKGDGNIDVTLASLRPTINGNLALNGLDLRPYLIAQNPSGAVKPWSEEPLNFQALTLFDAALTLTTPTLIAGRVQMDNSEIKATINNGVLKTNLADAALYGGIGDLDLILDAKANTPKIKMDFTLKDMDGKGFLGAAAGFTQLTGNTGTTFSVTGTGNNQSQIMGSLNGDGLFEVAQGIIAGIDLVQLGENFNTLNPQSLLQSRALPTGLGSQYSTEFEKLAGKFTINNGIISVGDFNFKAGNIQADASGTLDLGKQLIDFSLRPYQQGASGLAGFGLPLRFSGGFGTVSASLDTQQLQKAIAAQTKAKLQKTITDQIGKGLGSKGLGGKGLGSIIGTGNSSLGNSIGNILTGGQKKTAPTPTDTTNESNKEKDEPAEKPKTENELENVLKNIFGGG